MSVYLNILLGIFVQQRGLLGHTLLSPKRKSGKSPAATAT